MVTASERQMSKHGQGYAEFDAFAREFKLPRRNCPDKFEFYISTEKIESSLRGKLKAGSHEMRFGFCDAGKEWLRRYANSLYDCQAPRLFNLFREIPNPQDLEEEIKPELQRITKLQDKVEDTAGIATLFITPLAGIGVAVAVGAASDLIPYAAVSNAITGAAALVGAVAGALGVVQVQNAFNRTLDRMQDAERSRMYQKFSGEVDAYLARQGVCTTC